jgi:hypothetical protein
MANLISEYNFCKKQFKDNNIDIIVDILLTKLYRQHYLEGEIYPKNNDKVLENKQYISYYQSFQYHFKGLQLKEDGLIEDKYFSDKSGLKYINHTGSIFKITKIPILKINFKELRKEFPVLKRFRPVDFTELIRKIHISIFNFTEFKCKYYNVEKWNKLTKQKGNWDTCKTKIKSRLCRSITNPIYEYNKKGKSNVLFELDFNTKLGHLIVRNLNAVGYKIIPPEAYDLLKQRTGSAYKIFKKLIFPYYGQTKCPLNISDIKEIQNNNRDDNLKRSLIGSMKLIEKTGLITDVEFESYRGIERIKYKRVNWIK